jgi:hypothetical protein
VLHEVKKSAVATNRAEGENLMCMRKNTNII